MHFAKAGENLKAREQRKAPQWYGSFCKNEISYPDIEMREGKRNYYFLCMLENLSGKRPACYEFSINKNSQDQLIIVFTIFWWEGCKFARSLKQIKSFYMITYCPTMNFAMIFISIVHHYINFQFSRDALILLFSICGLGRYGRICRIDQG